MLHALLTSSGFGGVAVWKEFCRIVHDFKYKTAAIIPTAHPQKEKAIWAQETKQQMESLHINTIFVDLATGDSLSEKIDIVYVCGGNTFSLLHAVKETSFTIQLKKLFSRGGLYVGSSAGSVIVSPTIASAAEVHPDKNVVGLKDLTGLGYIDFHIIPHFENSDSREVQAFAKRHIESVETLANGEALYIYNDTIKKIQ